MHLIVFSKPLQEHTYEVCQIPPETLCINFASVTDAKGHKLQFSTYF